MNLQTKYDAATDHLTDLMAARASLILQSENGEDVGSKLSANTRDIQTLKQRLDDLRLAQQEIDRQQAAAEAEAAERAAEAARKHLADGFKAARSTATKIDKTLAEFGKLMGDFTDQCNDLRAQANALHRRELVRELQLLAGVVENCIGTRMPPGVPVGLVREKGQPVRLLADAVKALEAAQ